MAMYQYCGCLPELISTNAVNSTKFIDLKLLT